MSEEFEAPILVWQWEEDDVRWLGMCPERIRYVIEAYEVVVMVNYYPGTGFVARTLRFDYAHHGARDIGVFTNLEEAQQACERAWRKRALQAHLHSTALALGHVP